MKFVVEVSTIRQHPLEVLASCQVLSDNPKNAETPAMVLIEFPLTCFLITALSSKQRETKVSSFYTWTDDTAEGCIAWGV